MNSARKKRLEELRKMFNVTVVDGQAPPQGVVAETVAMYLNHKHGRQVVVPRERTGQVGSSIGAVMSLAATLVMTGPLLGWILNCLNT